MIGEIATFVKSGSTRKERFRPLGLHILGGASGGIVMGCILGFVGVALATIVGHTAPQRWLLACALVVFGYLDIVHVNGQRALVARRPLQVGIVSWAPPVRRLRGESTLAPAFRPGSRVGGSWPWL